MIKNGKKYKTLGSSYRFNSVNVLLGEQNTRYAVKDSILHNYRFTRILARTVARGSDI